MTTYLTDHFSVEELTATQHRGIDNTPPFGVVEHLRRLALVLEMVRQRLGAPVLVTSGYRSPALNAAVGGQPKSQHLTGDAADFICPQFGPPAKIVAALRDSGIPFDQLINEFDRWVHISWVSEGRRGQVLKIDERGARPFEG